jgi:cyclophilin family peptidyl-prolyl cis-trans isomerase/Ca2+-binding RTX toxin-like protein
LADLPAGTYTVAVTPVSGWAPTYPSLSTSASTVLSNQGADQALSIGPMASTPMTLQEAQATYQGLGLATGIAGFRADVRFADLQGQGQAVVILDTGIDPDHPAFGADANGDGVADRIVYQYDFVGSNDALALDGEGHGTHVAGIIGSADSQYGGIAPQADLIVLKVLDDQGSGDGYDIQEAMNWVVANASRYNIAAVNLSLGDGSFYTTAASGYLSSQIQALTNSGVMVVAAAGNGYGTNSRQGVAYPAADPYALAVGAVWASAGQWGSSQTGSTDAIAFFSQRDDTESDIFAPGVSIPSAQAGGGYVSDSGTSMAAPQVTGMITLAQQLAQRELGRRLSFDELRGLLKSTGDTIKDGDDERDQVVNTGLNFKRIDMLALAEAIVSMRPAISHTVTLSAGEQADGRHFGFAPTVTVQALASDDMVVGTQFGEILKGGAGADRIEAGEGDDELFGQDGDDELSGGAGSDRFIFNPSGDGQDTITDLSSDDRIDVPGIEWQTVAEGAGEQILAGQIQVQVVNGSTLLSMGTDDTPGAELQLTLPGVFSASQFTVSGSQIGLLAVDSAPPTVQFSDNQSGIINLESLSSPSITYTLTFSEPVTGLDKNDISLNVGTVSTVAGSGTSWTVTVDTGYLFSGNLQITLKAGAVTDAGGNPNALASDSSQAMDTEFPRTPSLTARGITTPLIDPRVKFDTTLGSFTLELDPDLAPFSANNLLNYVTQDFYDGTIFHRIVNQADLSGMQIVQGGGFTPGLLQKPTEAAIPLESANGLSNVRGTVAMARTNVPNSGTSQFYINVDDNLFLDYRNQSSPGYAVFGRVVDGMAVIDQMLTKPVNASDVPLTDIVVSQANIVRVPSTVYSRTGLIDMGQIEAGATLYYSIDGGKTIAQSSNGEITVPVGTYYLGNILTWQVDGADNASNPGMYGRNLVVDKTVPSLLSVSPASGTANVGVDAPIVLTFDEPILAGSGQILLKTAAGTTIATYLASDPNVSTAGSELTITPATALSAGTAYTVQWTEGAVTDRAGNPHAGSTFNFSTASTIPPKFWKNASLTPSETNKTAAVNLNDAISVLKMIVGLPVNSNNAPLAPHQSIAADFNQNGQVGLDDAIGMLKLVVGLDAPSPTWRYYDADKLKTSLSGNEALAPASWANSARIDDPTTTGVRLVGVLTGDVDGSWAG